MELCVDLWDDCDGVYNAMNVLLCDFDFIRWICAVFLVIGMISLNYSFLSCSSLRNCCSSSHSVAFWIFLKESGYLKDLALLSNC